jgi:hypothetical protein
MRLRTTLVFVDSRYAIGAGGSSIHFQIPGGVELGPNARCFVSEFTCVCAWQTIDESNRYQRVSSGAIEHDIAIPVGSYDVDSFANASEVALRNDLGAGFEVNRTGAGGTGSTRQLLRVTHPTMDFMLMESPLSKIVRFPQAFGRDQPETLSLDFRALTELW